MPEITRLLLLRHAEVAVRFHRVFGGSRIDMELSPRGHEQAAALAGYLTRHKLDAVYASPMLRVRETMQPLLTQQPLTPVVLEDLREVDFGAWTGLRWEEVHERFQISAFDWLDHLERASIPDGESAAQLRARVGPCLQRILCAHPGQTVAVACHGGVIRMLLALLLDLPLGRTAGMDVEYASLTEVRHRPGKAEVQLLNFTPWRDLA